MKKEIFVDCSECEYLEVTYEEWDTGYKEYDCTFIGEPCPECCPFWCKYTVEE
jgi:hypothetical protein